MDAAEKLSTYEDLLAFPEDVRAEVIAGRVVTTPAPLPRHAKVQRSLSRFVGGPFDDDDGVGGPGGWWVLLEVDVRLGMNDIVRPDMSGWKRERLVDPWDVRPIDVRPDWVCEIISLSTARRDRLVKTRLYREAGVPALGIIDPEARVLEAFVLEDGPPGEAARWVDAGRCGDGDIARIPPFDAIELDVARLFPPLSEPLE